MKNINITVSCDDEKLTAIKLYMEQKGLSLDEELTKAVDSLYQKYVPVNVRDFIGLRSGGEKSAPKIKKAKPVTPPADDKSGRVPFAKECDQG